MSETPSPTPASPTAAQPPTVSITLTAYQAHLLCDYLMYWFAVHPRRGELQRGHEPGILLHEALSEAMGQRVRLIHPDSPDPQYRPKPEVQLPPAATQPQKGLDKVGFWRRLFGRS